MYWKRRAAPSEIRMHMLSRLLDKIEHGLEYWEGLLEAVRAAPPRPPLTPH